MKQILKKGTELELADKSVLGSYAQNIAVDYSQQYCFIQMPKLLRN